MAGFRFSLFGLAGFGFALFGFCDFTFRLFNYSVLIFSQRPRCFESCSSTFAQRAAARRGRGGGGECCCRGSTKDLAFAIRPPTPRPQTPTPQLLGTQLPNNPPTLRPPALSGDPQELFALRRSDPQLSSTANPPSPNAGCPIPDPFASKSLRRPTPGQQLFDDPQSPIP